MQASLFLATGAAEQIATFAMLALFFLLVGVVPFVFALQGMYYLLTLPMRRNERCRIFLDLLEIGLKQGRSPEAAITDAAGCKDQALGKPFLIAAEYLRQGGRLSQALYSVPRLAPPQIRGMLKVGEQIGDVGKVLPACRLLLSDGVSHVRSALNYLIVLAILGVPFSIFVPFMLKVKVLPTFRAVFAGMGSEHPLPAFTRFVFAENSWFIMIQVLLFAFVWLATAVYLGGPRLKDMLDDMHFGQARWIDWLALRLPWREKRLQRDFSAMLAVLLESGVRELDAVRLAAESTANGIMRDRARDVCTRLEQGASLPEALEAMDVGSELRWRLTNALRRGAGFNEALAGWHEALDAKAFQLEQSAAQITTTVVVLVNGALIASFVIAMFLPLIQLMNDAVLW